VTVGWITIIALGYDPGPANGELTVSTQVAISKFQTQNGLAVTGEATPQLAGILSARVEERKANTQPTSESANEVAGTTASSEKGCESKVAKVEEKSRRFGRFASAVGDLLGAAGQEEAAEAAEGVGDVSSASAERSQLMSLPIT
jgi:peptidoglycan hydrolase-like protein with peptidoglycan-binding domain